MVAQLPEREQKSLDFIREYIEDKGYPPTIREIGDAIDVSSTSLVSYYLNKLEERELISREPSSSRAIQLTEPVEEETQPPIADSQDTISIPFLGYIAAGEPMPVNPLPGLPDAETVEINQALFGRDTDDLFALEVEGESMIDALIDDGDIVVFRKHQDRVEPGQMAAVWLKSNGETTLKKIYYEGQRIKLQPANPTMEPIYVPADDVEIQGKVVLVIRHLE
jgi:repressor LexA